MGWLAEEAASKECREVLGEEHILLQEDFAARQPPGVRLTPPGLVAAADKEVGLGFDPVLVDDEPAADIDLACVRDRGPRFLDLDIGDDMAEPL
jgi:hypothetical protein